DYSVSIIGELKFLNEFPFMESLIAVIRAMITISDQELTHLLGNCLAKRFKKQEILSKPYVTPNEIFFVQKGMIRVLITDENGIDHTIHF
ncbi:hypothetical protein VJJ19_07615, partial [Parvimonas sp. D4]|nr:hypothetical protein [Parvimonas sp. D4]